MDRVVKESTRVLDEFRGRLEVVFCEMAKNSEPAEGGFKRRPRFRFGLSATANRPPS
jgi:hypothetical protein